MAMRYDAGSAAGPGAEAPRALAGPSSCVCWYLDARPCDRDWDRLVEWAGLAPRPAGPPDLGVGAKDDAVPPSWVVTEGRAVELWAGEGTGPGPACGAAAVWGLDPWEDAGLVAAGVGTGAGGGVGLADRAAADRMACAGRMVAECCRTMRARRCLAPSSSSLEEEDLDSASAVEVYPRRVAYTWACLSAMR